MSIGNSSRKGEVGVLLAINDGEVYRMLKSLMKRVFLLFFFFTTLLGAKYTNELIYEESPYLLQHAHNPVHWHAWGTKAFELAKKEHKPIFLSIGYSTCHWCHVMERESFENEEIAKLINDNFIPIKVDKEERPDLDRYYQLVYQVMHHRSGGWPLTIIMTEDKKPFFSATYIPPEDGYGVKGLRTILPILAKAYKTQRALIEKRGQAIQKLVQEALSSRYVPVELDLSLATKALAQIKKSYDRMYGGFSKRIKFPQPSTIDLLLDIYLITHDSKALTMATHTLEAMAKGGIFDQIEGGFFRYSVDRKWTIPHFEKMLYTNAELIHVYTRAYRLTKNPLFKEVVVRTIEQMDKRFGQSGLYYGASDADSEGKEGAYYLYSYDEALGILRKKMDLSKAKRELEALGIEPDGNFDGELSNPVKKAKVDPQTIRLLAKVRAKRAFPFIDKKIITAWNAMYLRSKMEAFIFKERYKQEALRSLDLLIGRLYKKRLYHQIIGNEKPKKEAMLEDYAYLIRALAMAYELSLEHTYLDRAYKLMEEVKKRFWDKGRWYFSTQEHKLPADLSDSYYSSALATLYLAMLDLSSLRSDRRLYALAKASIEEKSALIFHNPGFLPTATKAALRLQIGDVIVKAKKQGLMKILKPLQFVRYPYLLDKEANLSGFLACTMGTCFKEAQEFGELKKTIESILEKKATTKAVWRSNGKR